MDAESIPNLTSIFNISSFELVWNGETFPNREPDQVEEAKFCTWLAREAKMAILNDPDISEERRERELEIHRQSVAAGEFDWFSPARFRAFQTVKGFAAMAHILHAPKLSHRDAEKAIREAVLKKMTDFVSEGARDPKVRAVLECLGMKFESCEPGSTAGSSASSTLPSDPPATSPPSPACPPGS